MQAPAFPKTLLGAKPCSPQMLLLRVWSHGTDSRKGQKVGERSRGWGGVEVLLPLGRGQLRLQEESLRLWLEESPCSPGALLGWGKGGRAWTRQVVVGLRGKTEQAKRIRKDIPGRGSSMQPWGWSRVGGKSGERR